MPTKKEITIGFRIPRNQREITEKIAKRAGFPKISKWLRAIYDREMNAEILKLVGDGK